MECAPTTAGGRVRDLVREEKLRGEERCAALKSSARSAASFFGEQCPST